MQSLGAQRAPVTLSRHHHHHHHHQAARLLLSAAAPPVRPTCVTCNASRSNQHKVFVDAVEWCISANRQSDALLLLPRLVAVAEQGGMGQVLHKACLTQGVSASHKG